MAYEHAVGSSWSRWRRVAAVVAGLSALLLGIGVLFPTDVWRVERNGGNLTLAFLQDDEAAAERDAPLIADDFSNATGGWTEHEESNAVVAIGDGVLHVRLLEAQTIDFEAPHARIGELAALHVETTARIAAGRSAAVVGLFCAVSGGPDVDVIGAKGGYIFMLHPATRTMRIGRVPAPFQTAFAKAAVLREAPVPAALLRGSAIRLAADCAAGGGAESLVVSVGGRPVLSAASRAGDTAFDSAGVVAYHGGGPAEMAVDFDDFSVSSDR